MAHEPSLPPGGGSQSVLGSIATAVTPFDVAAEGSLRQRAVAVLLGHASKAFGGLPDVYSSYVVVVVFS